MTERRKQHHWIIGLLVTGLLAGLTGRAVAQEDTAEPAADEPEANISLIEKVIGYPYNVRGNYADFNDVIGSHQVFDFSAAAKQTITIGETDWQVPQLIKIVPSDLTGKTVFSGTTKTDFLKKIAASVGLSGDASLYFGGAFDASFSSEQSGSTEHVYTQLEVREPTLRASFKSKNYRQYLLPDVRAMIDSLPLEGKENRTNREDFFNHYAYIVVDALFGGKVVLYADTTTTDKLTKSEMESTISAAYDSLSLAQAKGGSSANASSKVTDFLTNSALTLTTSGGDSDSRPVDKSELAEKRAAWQETIEAFPDLIAFSKNGLLPIWDLAETPARKEVIKKAYALYQAEQSKLGVTVYSECNFKGTSATLMPGSYDEGYLSANGLNNKISSLKIDPGIVVKLYDTGDFNQRVTGAIFTKASPTQFFPDENGSRAIKCFKNLKSVTWLDKAVSSIEVKWQPVPRDLIYVYPECNFGGQELIVAPEQAWGQSVSLKTVGSLRLGSPNITAELRRLHSNEARYFPDERTGRTQQPCFKPLLDNHELDVSLRNFPCPSGELIGKSSESADWTWDGKKWTSQAKQGESSIRNQSQSAIAIQFTGDRCGVAFVMPGEVMPIRGLFHEIRHVHLTK